MLLVQVPVNQKQRGIPGASQKAEDPKSSGPVLVHAQQVNELRLLVACLAVSNRASGSDG